MISSFENIFIVDDDVESNHLVGQILRGFSKDIIMYSNWDNLNTLPLQAYTLVIFNSTFVQNRDQGLDIFITRNQKKIGKELFCMLLLDSVHFFPEEDYIENFIYKPARKFEVLFAAKNLMKKIQIIHENKVLKSSIIIKENTTLKEIEKQVIVHTVNKFDGSKAKAANLLDISKRSIELKYKEWNIS